VNSFTKEVSDEKTPSGAPNNEQKLSRKAASTASAGALRMIWLNCNNFLNILKVSRFKHI
ncbi:MAG: hypothetical protein LUH47_10995, partial [Clostridiales bacterium]|nr:hypothetical protein [Clostridiales bacterium]